MKNRKFLCVVGAIAIAALVLAGFASCASSGGSGSGGLYKPLSEVPNAQVIGTIQTEFTAPFDGLSPVTETTKQAAYIELKKAAAQQYEGNIDVRDITVIFIEKASALWITGSYSADGTVVLLSGGKAASSAKGVEGGLARAADQIMNNIQPRSRVAIVYVTSRERDVTEYIANELEYIMVNDGFTLIDRSQLDQIRREQGFQMSGEVDDATAVSIGKIIGANVIITGAVTGAGDLRRLRLRALNTQTAQVLATASEKY